MKKSTIWVLLTVTLVFVAFDGGMYAGRNFHHSDIQINGSASTPSDSTAPTSDKNGSTAPDIAPDSPTTTVSTPVFPININTATAEQLDLLPDIGPVLAKRIVDYRQQFGLFTSVEDLLYINGIGEKTLAKILQYITV
jgi:competence protein ComEA